MTAAHYSLLLYAFFWIVRINGCIRRGREPLLRGPEWFFDVHVPPDFYSRVGRDIVRRYHARMLLPFAIDIPVAAAILYSGHITWLNGLIAALAAIIHVNHSFSTARARYEARPFAVPEAEEPPTAMAVSLAPRRLRDYSSPAIEAVVVVGTVSLFAWLIAYYLTATERLGVGDMFGVPVLMAYLQLGLLCAKALAIALPAPLPRRDAAAHLEAREEVRRHWALLCDGGRVLVTVSAFYWPMMLVARPEEKAHVMGTWFLAWFAAGVAGTAWAEIRRRRLASRVSRVLPARMPEVGDDAQARGPVSFEPSMPTLFLRGLRGLSLNLASRWVYLAAGYAAGFVALVVLTSGGAHADPLPGAGRLAPCASGEGPSDGFCGTLTVFENRAARAGRTIALRIVVLPALRPKVHADPLFILAGGPGQGAARLAPSAQALLEPVEVGRDIVFVDQRGTGQSNPLDCKEGRLDDCLVGYRGRADVTQYTTEIAMDDLDDVREFLGYPRIDLYGISYGTRAAMVYARRHRGHVGAVVLDGVMPPDMRLPLSMARDGERALDLLFRDCEREAECARRFPRLPERTRALMDQLAAHPRPVRYRDPLSGTEKDAQFTRLVLSQVLFAALYSPTTSAMVPLLIEQAEDGNFTGFYALGAATRAASESVAKGLLYSVVCSEDASRIAPGDLVLQARGTLLGAELGEAFLAPCETWPRGRVPASFFEDAPSDVPALILSGEADPVTPPSRGEQVAALWKRSTHVVLRATAHLKLASGSPAAACITTMVAAFLDAGTASAIDTSCTKRLRRPAFFVAPSGPSMKASG